MNTTESRFIRTIATVAALGCVGVIYFGLRAVNFDLEAMGDPSGAITGGEAAASFGQLAMLSDVLGFYLLQIPIALFLWRRLRSESGAIIDYATVAGVLYCLTGVIGAAILSVAFPFLIASYENAPDPLTQQSAVQLFALFSEVVNLGLWGRVEFLLAAVWWIGVGVAARPQREKFGWLSILLGAVALLAWAGSMASFRELAAMSVNIYLILTPVWLLSIAFGPELEGRPGSV